MDNRMWDTAQILMGGILDKPIPKSSVPNNLILHEVNDFDFQSHDDLRVGLEKCGLNASQYYGVWTIWKTESGYSGELMQYREITDKFENVGIESALDKAIEWYFGCYG